MTHRSSRLVDQTSRLTESFAGKDEELGEVITDLNVVVDNLARHNDSLDEIISQTRDAVSTFDARRPELVSSMGSISRVVRQLSTIADEVYPDLNELVLREPGFAEHMVGIEPQLAFTGANLPLLLEGFRAHHQRGRIRQRLCVRPERHRLLPRPQRRGADHRRRRDPRKQGVVHAEMQEHGQWLIR